MFVDPLTSSRLHVDGVSIMPEGEKSQYPPSLSPEESSFLVSQTKDWSMCNGLAVRPSFVPFETDPSRSLATTAPVTLFPSRFPRSCFQEARALQNAYSELYAAVARDEVWLGKVIEE